jgi:hypothetical protein
MPSVAANVGDARAYKSRLTLATISLLEYPVTPPLSLNVPAFFLGFLVATASHCGVTLAQVSWESRLQAQYPEAESHWTNVLENISCDVHESSNQGERSYRLFTKGDAGGYVRSNMTPAGVLERIYVWTPESTFRLESSPRGESYRIIAATNATDAGADFVKTSVPKIFESDSRLKSMIQVLDTPVSDLISSGAPLKFMTEIDHDGRKLPQFQFDYSGLESNFNTVTIILDPENNWGLTAWTVDFKATVEGIGRTATEIAYDVSDGEVGSFPKTIRDTALLLTGSETKELRVRTTTVSNIQLDMVQDSEFQLVSYGVPDVLKRATSSRYPFDSLAFWCALAIGIVTLGILWRTRKRYQHQ